MNLDRINLYALRMELQSPFETSFGRIATRDCLLLEVMAGGLVGLGECVADRDPGFSYETAQTAWHILRDFLIPDLLGRPLPEPADLAARWAFVRGHPMAKAALEMALWDLIGQAEGRSLRDLLGGRRARVEVGVSVGLQGSPTRLIETVAAYVAEGYGRVKLKIKPGHDVAEVTAVRQVFPELRLQVDANSAYTLASAAALEPLDALDLLLIEQPLAEDDLWDHHLLQKRLHTPICLDESIVSERAARQALEMDAARVINIKVGRVGGLGAARAIHDLCRARGVPVWCGGMLETGVGRAANLALAALPGFTLPGDVSATARYYAEDVTVERFALEPDSTIRVPDRPGLGVALDHNALAKVTLGRETFA